MLVGCGVIASCTLSRGCDFPREFSNIGEIRAVIPKLNVMALTATATHVTRKLIIQTLEMSTNCHCIVKVPELLNITYSQKEIERRHEVYYSTIGARFINERHRHR